MPAKTAARQPETKPDPTGAEPLETLVGMQTASLNSMAWLGTAWMSNAGDVGTELMQFLAKRIKEDVRTQHEMLHCKDLTKLQDIQMRFVQTAMEQYAAETEKLLQMGSDMMAEAGKHGPS